MKKHFIVKAITCALVASQLFNASPIHVSTPFAPQAVQAAMKTLYIDKFDITEDNQLVLTTKKGQGNGYFTYALWVSNANKVNLVGNAPWIAKEVKINTQITSEGTYWIDVVYPKLPQGVSVEDLGISVSYFASATSTTPFEGFGGNLGQIKKNYVKNNGFIKEFTVNENNELVLSVNKGQGTGSFGYYLWAGRVDLADAIGNAEWNGKLVKINANITTAGKYTIKIDYPKLPNGFTLDDVEIGIVYFKDAKDTDPVEETASASLYRLKQLGSNLK